MAVAGGLSLCVIAPPGSPSRSGYRFSRSQLGMLTPGASLMTDAADTPEKEPDVRFTYANERTFLAWNRTALALIATGVAATQLLPRLQVAWGRRPLGLLLVALGAIVAA